MCYTVQTRKTSKKRRAQRHTSYACVKGQ